MARKSEEGGDTSETNDLKSERLSSWIQQSSFCDVKGPLVLHAEFEDTRSFSETTGTYRIPDIDPKTKVQGKVRHSFLVLWNETVTKLLRLQAARIETEPPSEGKLGFPFSIELSTGQKYRLSAHSERDRSLWIQKLKKASEERVQVTDGQSQRNATETRKLRQPVLHAEMCSKLIGESDSVPFKFNPNSSRKALCNEWIGESKLSILLPLELLNIYQHENSSLFKSLKSLESQTKDWKQTSQRIRRKITENKQRLESAKKFLERHSRNGPFFKPSIAKSEKEFGFSPVNLHIQRFSIARDHSKWSNTEFLTSGAIAAIPLGLESGGMISVWKKLGEQLKQSPEDYRFIKKSSQFWHLRSFFSSIVQKLNSFQQKLTESARGEDVKRILETAGKIIQLLDQLETRIEKFTEIKEGARVLLRQEKNESAEKEATAKLAEHSKAMQRLRKQVQHIQQVQGHKAKDVTDSAEFGKLWDSMAAYGKLLNQGHLVRFLQSLSGSAHLQDLFFHLESRSEMVFSQALATVCSGIMAKFWLSDAKSMKMDRKAVDRWHKHGLVFMTLSHLTAGGNRQEESMLEDSVEAWNMVGKVCRFHFLRAPPDELSVIPVLKGNRGGLEVGIPIPGVIYESLFADQEIRSFDVHPILWNVGINMEALAPNPLEHKINRRAVKRLKEYLTLLQQPPDDAAEGQDRCLRMMDILKTWTGSHSDKERLLEEAAMASRKLDGVTLFNCKSGKDRTGMATTLEEARILKWKKKFTKREMQVALERFRTEGVRRRNCTKNIGIPCYAINAMQIPFLPKSYRPPKGTYGSSQT